MNTSSTEWILWSATVGRHTSLKERAIAARAAGFTRFSVSPIDITKAEKGGWPAADIGKWAATEGLGLTMDPVLNWHPYERAWSAEFAQFSLGEILRMTRELGCKSMTALAMEDCPFPVSDLAEPFRQLCREVAPDGIAVHLEFIPMSVVRDLGTAWEIVRRAEEPNGGLLVDTWHFFRSTPDFELLGSIPGERIFAVQISDAAADVSGSLWDDTRQRKLPGDGDLDLLRVVRILASIGGLSLVGPEVISPDLAAMPCTDAAALGGERVRSLVRLAGA